MVGLENHSPFTVYAMRHGRVSFRSDGTSTGEVQPLACEQADTFDAAAEIARSFAVTYGYPEGLLLSQMEWAKECCTGNGPDGSPPAYSFGSPSLLGFPDSWVSISIDAAEYTEYTARVRDEYMARDSNG